MQVIEVGFDFLFPSIESKFNFFDGVREKCNNDTLVHCFLLHVVNTCSESILDFLPPFVPHTDCTDSQLKKLEKLLCDLLPMASSGACSEQEVDGTTNAIDQWTKLILAYHRQLLLQYRLLLSNDAQSTSATINTTANPSSSSGSSSSSSSATPLPTTNSFYSNFDDDHDCASAMRTYFVKFVTVVITHCAMHITRASKILLPVVLASLYNLSFDMSFCNDVLPHLQLCISLVERMDRTPLTSSSMWAVFPKDFGDARVIESLHPYGVDSAFHETLQWEQTIHYLTLEFDQRCNLHPNARLLVQVSLLAFNNANNNSGSSNNDHSAAQYRTVANLSSSNWPTSRMIIRGDNVRLVFTPEDTALADLPRHSNFYGFRCYARGYRYSDATYEQPPHCLHTKFLRRELCCLSGFLAASLVVGNGPQCVYPEVLNSELFARARIPHELTDTQAQAHKHTLTHRRAGSDTTIINTNTGVPRCVLSSSGPIKTPLEVPCQVSIGRFYEMFMGSDDNMVTRFAAWFQRTEIGKNCLSEPTAVATNAV
jgi:hypothetical protein